MKSAGGVLIALCLIVAIALAGEEPSGSPLSSAKPQGMSVRLELFVDDVEKSADFYTKILGFERMRGQPNYVPVRAGSVVIGLGPAKKLPQKHYFNPQVQSDRRGLGAEIVLEVDDVKAAFAQVEATGYEKILSPLRKQFWGLTDFRLADPDGYYLRITSRE